MSTRLVAIALAFLAGALALTTNQATATHPFDNVSARYEVKVADNRPAVASDLSMALRFSSPSAAPDPFGGITHKTPAGWRLAPDEAVPNGDKVGQLDLLLDNPLIMGPSPCPLAPMPALWVRIGLTDASSDSSAPDYPPFLPPGEHQARWTGRIEYGANIIPVNVLVDPEDSVASGNRVRIFVGDGSDTGLPLLNEPKLGSCFSLSVVLDVFAKSSSGAAVAVNPDKPGLYTFLAAVTSNPDPTDSHIHTFVLKDTVLIKGGPAGYKVDVRDHNPGVASDLYMALGFRPKDKLPQPFGGITHTAPVGWSIAADEDVPDGDGLARLALRLDLPPTLTNVCPAVLALRPSLKLSVPLRDASSDSSAADYPNYLPPGEHKARWTGRIGRLYHRIPVNVLVDETSTGGTSMRVYIGTKPLHLALRPLAHCLSLDVILHVAGHSRSGVPVAVNPPSAGTYEFVARIVTLPKPGGTPKTFDLSAKVEIAPSPTPAPCVDCPPNDEDGDKITDDADLCLEDPEDADAYDKADGCPDSGDDDGDELANLMELLLTSDAAAQDSDGDGCDDAAEVSSSPAAGGERDPMSFWDFFDATRDGSVSGFDFFAVLSRFNAAGDPGIDPLSAVPPAPGYHTAFDRTAGTTFTGPPDGAVSGVDLFLALAQFNHSCLP